MSQTPNFDKAINEILQTVKPHQRTCPQCGAVFDIYKEDIEFYRLFQAPPPSACPRCRLQRLLGYRINFLPIFYKKTCSAPGHQEKIISTYSESNPIKIYDYEFWHSDYWNPLQFGRNFDFSQSFFKQFRQFILEVPHPALYKDPRGVNSDYVVSGIAPKNCYYSSVPYYAEDVYYSHMATYSKNCMDVNDVNGSQMCYESFFLWRCYNCYFCQECYDCLDCYFLFDCKNCQYCFGSTNLRNKKYYFFNQPLSKEEYQGKIKEINLGKRSVVKEYWARFEKLRQSAIRKNLNLIKTENSYGNDLRGAKNCFFCFYSLGEAENLRYATHMDKVKETMDFFGGSQSSLLYDSTGISFSNRIKFSAMNRHSLDLEYCLECHNCQHCFASFGLRNKKFCIFNKQYSEEDYWQMVDKIKIQMLEVGEYGEFLPLSISWVPYNDSSASIEMPLSREEVLENGWYWQDEIESDIDFSQYEVLRAGEVPDEITDVSDEILNKVIICEQTGKPFRITSFELQFYRQKNLPLPVVHPLQRMKNRFAFRHPFRLWQYPCSKCGKMMHSGWDPAKNYKVYCESCYLAEVV